MKNSENNLLNWLPQFENLENDLASQEKALNWLGGNSITTSTSIPAPTPLEEKFPITTSIPAPTLLEEKFPITTSNSITTPLERKTQISNKIGTQPDFNESIIRIFSGEPAKVVPPIQNQRDGLSMLDFFGRGFATQGPANHSQPLRSRHQQVSRNQTSLLDFVANPFQSQPSTSVNFANCVNGQRASYLLV
jgi:hypothetical protein